MTTVAVVGLGYVGLPLAVEFGKRHRTIGFDLSAEKVESYRRHVDPTGEVSTEELRAATMLSVGSDAAALADLGYRVIMMVSGPSVLNLLLAAKRLDLLYVTEAQMEIPVDDPAAVQTMLSGGRKIGELQEFHLAHKFVQEQVQTEDGSIISQSFLRYDAKHIRRSPG